MIDRRDFRYMVLKYSGIAEKFTSDLGIVQKIMRRIYRELGSEQKRLEPESVRVLSNQFTRELIKKVSQADPELEAFGKYMEYWYKVFSEFSLDEVINPEKNKNEVFPRELRGKELEFNVILRQKIGNYLIAK
jgi:hypothetical protein